jgi:hypothetical protein
MYMCTHAMYLMMHVKCMYVYINEASNEASNIYHVYTHMYVCMNV